MLSTDAETGGKVKVFRKKLHIAVLVFFAAAFLSGIAALGINNHICIGVKPNILKEEQAAALSDVDCILVLGCGVRDDGTPSPMLADRLQRGVSLYQLQAAPKLLMTGDHGREEYDEVNTMKKYALDCGIDGADVFMDHAGFSTYESMYRAKEIFQAEKIIIVTQQYHLYRAVYIAEQLGLEAYGVASDYRSYAGQPMREIREVLARVKDFVMCIVQPKPTYLGDVIPISGDGALTDD